MANNLIANQLNSKVALSTKTWAQLGFNSSTVSIVYLLDPVGGKPVTTWKPGDPFSQLVGIERDQAYLIQPKVNLDLSLDFASPLPPTTTTTTSTTQDTTTTTSTSSTSSTTTSSTTIVAGTFIITPPVSGIYDQNMSAYPCGSTLIFNGTFKNVVLHNLNGCSGNRITIRNSTYTTSIGDPTWNGGAYSAAFVLDNCHYVDVIADNGSDKFRVSGSTQANRQAYFNITVTNHSDNIMFDGVSIRNGGTGLIAKTDPVEGDPSTYYPNAWLDNLEIKNMDVQGTWNECFYIGHTATWWDLTAGVPYNGDPSGFTPGHHYEQPIKWRNNKIHHNFVGHSGADGIQTAATDGLEIYNNEVTDWAQQQNYAHNGGILIGGRVTNSYVHDNIVHDSWGELLQFYGSGENGVPHVIYNNLFYGNQNDGISFRGSNNAVVQITNNTIANTGNVATRFNGFNGMTTSQLLNLNLIIRPVVNSNPNPETNPPTARQYIYTENGASVTEGTGPNANFKYATVELADVDPNYFYQPNPGSPIGNSGYRLVQPPSTTTTSTTTVPTTSSTTTTTTTIATTTTTTTTTLPVAESNRISVNLYGGTNPYNPSGQTWNNWDISGATSVYDIFNVKYENNIASNLSIRISDLVFVQDNGVNYPGIIAPQLVLRYAARRSGSCLIRITGCDDSKAYDLSFIASSSAGNSAVTSFTVGNPANQISTNKTTVSVPTDNNQSITAFFGELRPVGGLIMVSWGLVSGSSNYLNAFSIIEKTPSGTTTTSTSTSSTTTTSTTSLVPTTSTTTTTTTSGILPPLFRKVGNWLIGNANQYGYLYTANGYNGSDTNTKWPTVIMLHGQGESGFGVAGADGLLANGPCKFLNAGDKPVGVNIFAPQIANGTWLTSIVESARQFVINNWNADPNRIYFTGLSLGGEGTGSYVAQYPDRVAAYLVVAGSLGNLRTAANTSVNGVRVVDVPGWSHNGTSDSTVGPQNGVQTLVALNAISPKSLYPFLTDTYWGGTHGPSVWDDQVYNRKNKTTGGGTAKFDYIEWFLRFKAADLTFNSTSYVAIAEASNDYNDYLQALFFVNKMSTSSAKTALLSRLDAVKSVIDAQWKIIVASFGAGSSTSSVNAITNSTNGTTSAALNDINGDATTTTFTVVNTNWSPGIVSTNLGNGYYGFETSFFASSMRAYNSGNTWRINNLNDTKSYKIRFYFGDISQNFNLDSGGAITISSATKTAQNGIANTNKYIEFTSLTSSSGEINISLSSLVTNWNLDVYGIAIFESVSGGTTTTSTTTTAGTTSSTTTTTTTNTGLSAAFRFSPTYTYSTPGFADFVGNLATTDVSVTQNGITLSNVKANWQNLSAFYGAEDEGMSIGTFDPLFPASVVRGHLANYALVWSSPASYNMILSDLDPASSYTIKIISSEKSSVTTPGKLQVRLVGNGDEWNPSNQILDFTDNTQTYLTFTNITPDSGGNIRFGVFIPNAGDGGEVGRISGLRINKN